MSKRLDDCVHFANWCACEGLTPHQGAELIRRARRAHSAGTKECNVPGASADAARRRFEDAVGVYLNGYTVEWHGLWPSVVSHNPGKCDLNVPDIG